MELILLILAACVGIYVAINIGANDLANAMGTSVGSGSITIKQAVIICFFAEVLGASLAGSHVTGTISKGIIDPTLFSGSPEILLLGMFSALLAAGIWIHVATILGLPVSTTHAVVGAVVGFGLVTVGISEIAWIKILQIVASWFISPIMGGIITAFLFIFIERRIIYSSEPDKAILKYSPYLIFALLFVLILSLLYKGLHLELNSLGGIGIACLIAWPLTILGKKLVRRIVYESEHPLSRRLANRFDGIEATFAYFQVLTACYIAFAHGSNDVANAVGPLAAIFGIIKTHDVAMQIHVPQWMLAGGGLAIGIGLFLWGQRVMITIGKKITEITPSRGFCAQFGAATTILICSRLGLPISTTHVLVGSVIGIGLTRGLAALNLDIIKNIVYSWIVTLPFTVILSMILFKIIHFFIY
jgi:PiT family inorganic phosphate transporter